MSVIFIVILPLGEDFAEILVGLKSGSLFLSEATLRQEFKLRIIGGIQMLVLVWVLSGSGFLGLLNAWKSQWLRLATLTRSQSQFWKDRERGGA